MDQPESITVGKVKYIREDLIVTPIAMGEKRIIVCDRGWVFAGNCLDNDDGSVTTTNAKNIRRWGTAKGLGELVNGPLSDTVTDDYGTIKSKPIIELAIERGW